MVEGSGSASYAGVSTSQQLSFRQEDTGSASRYDTSCQSQVRTWVQLIPAITPFSKTGVISLTRTIGRWQSTDRKANGKTRLRTC